MKKIHNHARHPMYGRWRAMINRCYRKADTRYSSYGGRGIRVCDRWRDWFEAFVEDMGLPPSRGHTIDRIDNDGDYTPENCRWATMREQHRNTSRNITLTLGDQTRCISEWAEMTGINERTIGWRLRKGWPVEEILTAKPDKGSHSRRGTTTHRKPKR